jgi:hypothetical protein
LKTGGQFDAEKGGQFERNIHYPTYSLNSTAGKTLRALFDYSLRRGRNIEVNDEQPKWEKEIIELFEDTLRKGIVDAYILIGWHYPQFYFLDNNWLSNKIKEFYTLPEKLWLPFLAGFAFGRPPFNKEVYDVFYPHYERAIREKVEFKNLHDRGLMRHIVTFYLWGFETLESKGLFVQYINSSETSSVLDLVNFISRLDGYVSKLEGDEIDKFLKIILEFWQYMALKFENYQNEEEGQILANLSRLLGYVPILDKTYKDLTVKSIKVITNKHFRLHDILEDLARLKEKGNSKVTASYIAQIMNIIPFEIYISSIDNKRIIALVEFMYQNDQKAIADELCNKLAKQGYEFLISMHNKYSF